MTYCVGMALDQGVVMLADTRSNAGIDHIATFSKLAVVEQPGERVIGLMGSGNLASSQTVVSRLMQGVMQPGDDSPRTLMNVPNMFAAAELVGDAVRQGFLRDGPSLQAQNYSFDLNFLLAGQIAGGPVRMFLIYSAGNFIESTPDTPFLQIGEHKYGKPILDRVARYDTPLEDAVKLACISMDSTLRSNLSVGLPADLLIFRRDALRVTQRRRITTEDPYFHMIQERWSDSLRAAYRELPNPPWPMR